MKLQGWFTTMENIRITHDINVSKKKKYIIESIDAQKTMM